MPAVTPVARGCLPVRGGPVLQPLQHPAVGEVGAARIQTVGIDVPRQRHARIRCIGRGKERERIGRQPLERNRAVGDLVDERRVGAVLEQTAHEVGKQIAMAADRRVDAARDVLARHEHVVERVAHAVQLLELERAPLADAREDESDGVAIVRRELRKDAVARREQGLRARHVRDVGGTFARVHRVAVDAQHLRELDLGVPVGALHEPHHDAPARIAGEAGKPVAYAAARFW